MASRTGLGPVDRDDAQFRLDSLAADRAASGRRAAAPWWLIVLHGACVAGFALSFGMGERQAVGFAVSALVFVGLGVVRPWITRTQAEPWARSKNAARTGVLQFVSGIVIIAAGVLAYGPFGVDWALWPAAALAFLTTVLFGLQMERVLADGIAEGI